MPGGFDDDDIRTTTMMLETVPERDPKTGVMAEIAKHEQQRQIQTKLQLWPFLPEFKSDAFFGQIPDMAPLGLTAKFPRLFLDQTHLDIDLLRPNLPLKGAFSNLTELAEAHEAAAKSGFLGSSVPAIWRLWEMSEEFTWSRDYAPMEVVDPADAKKTLRLPPVMGAPCIPGGRFFDIVNILSWLLINTDDPALSELVEVAGTEKMVVKRSIYLAGITLKTKVSGPRGEYFMETGAYLRRATVRDSVTGRFGWVMEPIFYRTTLKVPYPLVTLCTPSDTGK